MLCDVFSIERDTAFLLTGIPLLHAKVVACFVLIDQRQNGKSIFLCCLLLSCIFFFMRALFVLNHCTGGSASCKAIKMTKYAGVIWG